MKKKSMFDSRVLIITVVLLMGLGAVASASGSTDTSEMETTEDQILQADDREMKQKTFYMYRVRDAVDVGGRTTKEMYNTTYPTGSGNATDQSDFRVLVDWYLYPSLADEIRLNGTSYLTVWGRIDSGTDSPDITYELSEVDEEGNEDLIQSTQVSRSLTSDWTAHQIPLDIDNYTVSEGSSLKVTYELEGNSGTDYQIAYGGEVDGGTRDTNVTLPTHDYLQVSDIFTRNSEDNATNLFNPDAQDKNITMQANITDPFGGYDVRWVNITLEGPEGTVFENESMNKTYGFLDSYRSIFEETRDYDGFPNGTYYITVRAVDKNGMTAYNQTGEFGNHDEYGEYSFVIGGLDNFVNLRLEDDEGELLKNTTVNLKAGSESIFNSKETDQEGIVNFTVANATYVITIMWQDVEVSTNRTLDVGETGNRTRNNTLNLTAGVYYPTLEILDREDLPVEDARAYMTHPNGTTTIKPMSTDENGTIYMERYAEGEYSFQIDWKGRNVGDQTITLDSSDTFSFNVDVCHLDVTIEDREENAVNNSLLISSYNDTGVVADSRLSDQTGLVNLRLPAADYHFEVLWNDANVYEGTFDLCDSGVSTTLTVDIFQVNVTVYDNQGAELPEASVTAVYDETDKDIDTVQTDETGTVQFQLAAGQHTFEVEWLDVDVAEETYEVNESSTEFVISADVYQLDIRPVDKTEDADTLPGAEITVYIDGSVADSGETDLLGSYISQLPATQVELRIRWRGIEVYEGTHDVSDDGTIYPSSDVYYLDTTVEDMEGNTTENVDLRIEHQDDIIVTGRTDTDGERTFRLPVETYHLKMRWRGFEVGDVTNVSITDDSETLTATAEIYHVDFQAVDSDGEPLDNADIDVIFDGDTYTSGRGLEEGTLSVRAPAETFTLEVDWQGVQVYSEEETVEGSEEIELESDVHDVSFSGFDSQDNAVDDLVVSLYHQDLPKGQDFLTTVDLKTTDETRVPAGEITAVGEWRGFHVGDENYTVESNETLTFECEIYYLEVDIVDSEGESLNGANLMVKDDRGVSFVTELAEDGVAVPRLAPGEWELNAFWRDEPVGEKQITIPEDEEITLETDVHDLNIRVEGENGPIEGAELTLIKDGEPIMTERTDGGGNATFSQVVEGEYEVNARFRTTQHLTSIDMENTTQVSLDETQDHVMTFEGYPKPIYKTNLFYLILGLAVIIMIGVVLVAKKKEVL